MKVDGKQKIRPEIGKPEDILAGLSCQKKRNLVFEKMKSFLKTEI